MRLGLGLGLSQRKRGASVSYLLGLTLSGSSLAEDAAAAAVVGAVQRTSTGSTLALTDSAGSRFALSGGNVVRGATGLDYEAATSHQIILRETLAGAVNSPRDNVITIAVTNVNDTNPSAFSFTDVTGRRWRPSIRRTRSPLPGSARATALRSRSPAAPIRRMAAPSRARRGMRSMGIRSRCG
jgi:hypothetical protein